MPSVFDADTFIQGLGCSGLTVRMKVLYEANRLSVRLLRRLIFEDRCEGWKNGPVFPELWRGPAQPGDTNTLSAVDKEILRFALKKLGQCSGKRLSARSHGFPEWIDARQGLASTDQGNNPITLADIRRALVEECDLYIDKRGYAIHTVPISKSRFNELKFYASTILPLVMKASNSPVV